MKIFARKAKGNMILEKQKGWKWYVVGFTIKQHTFFLALRVKNEKVQCNRNFHGRNKN